jgi:hypothetical protein
LIHNCTGVRLAEQIHKSGDTLVNDMLPLPASTWCRTVSRRPSEIPLFTSCVAETTPLRPIVRPSRIFAQKVCTLRND